MPKAAVSPKSDLVALGAALRRLRLERDFSQERLSLEAGLHRNYVGRVERGELSPTFEPLVAIAAALGVELDELMRLFLRERR